jgi:Domain of unknown function (DUF4268)/CBS domain
MPFPVKQLLEGCGKPVVVKKNDTVNHALSLMIDNDYSQLPVVDDEHQPLGMVTYESIVRGLVNFNARVDEILVSNVLTPVDVYTDEDDLFDLLNRLRDTNAVLIINFNDDLVGIVTSYDSTEYFRKRAEDLMYIEDIESIVKEMILYLFILNEQFPLDRDEIDEDGLKAAIDGVILTSDDVRKRYAAALGLYLNKTSIEQNKNLIDPQIFEESFKKLQADPKPRGFDDLNLSDYITLLTDKDRWTFYEPIFELGLEKVKNILNEVRKSRNILSHFQGELSPQQRDQIKFCADWLNRVQADYEKRKQEELIQGMRNSLVTQENEIMPESNQVSEDFDPTASKYAPLASWLQSHPGRIDRVNLSFDEIEQIIGTELPQSAYQHRNWWANDAVGHVQSKQWLDAGWRVGYRHMSAREVTFVRIKERERAYIDFFGPLISSLRERTELPIKDSSPDGASWIELIKLPKTGAQKSLINLSFASDSRFRVELYIDTGEKVTNKAIFDALKVDQLDIEREFNDIVKWERLDTKRASRIALYHYGNSIDAKETLKELSDWAFEKVQVFYDVMFERANQVIEDVISS